MSHVLCTAAYRGAQGSGDANLFLRSDKGQRPRRRRSGEDFVDIEAAKLEGLASARELLADAAKKGILATSPVYLVRNAAGDILATIPFKDALKPD